MGEIKLLPKNISDKIAAGEVVERPASIVKELIENAIDAGASAISVKITGGGIKEVCVTDNGSGIYSEDVNLAFEKHATSKISTLNDLDFIGTQGFRGEALSSISAVSIVEMKTKRRQEDAGTHLRISGGRVDFINPAGLPDGTSVCVNNLFFNVPARRKFLKKESYEAAYVSDLISRYILAFPEISFHYNSEGKTIYHSPGNGELKSAIYCVYGAGVMDTIVFVEDKANDVKVSGFVSRPGTVMKERRSGSIFVNRRYVRNTSLHDTVRSAYGETIVKGENPFFVLNIDLPLSSVDVNVHPNKLQVRFKDQSVVDYVIKEAVSKACGEIRGALSFDIREKTQRGEVEMKPAGEVQGEFFSGFKSEVVNMSDNEPKPRLEFNEHENASNTAENNYYRFYNAEKSDTEEAKTSKDDKNYYKNEFIEALAYSLIGSFGNTFVLVEQGENLLIIDQHAAHERLLYQKFKSAKSLASQALLSPYVMTVSHEQKNIIDENIDMFNSIGFDIEPFGVLDIKISAVPAVAAGVPVKELINDALGELQSGEDIVLRREAIIKAACRSAVKAGDKLNETELKSIVESFINTNVIPTCPHGRPVISVITKKQIEKSFKRII